jgi:hypothetical protein
MEMEINQTMSDPNRTNRGMTRNTPNSGNNPKTKCPFVPTDTSNDQIVILQKAGLPARNWQMEASEGYFHMRTPDFSAPNIASRWPPFPVPIYYRYKRGEEICRLLLVPDASAAARTEHPMSAIVRHS